MELSNRTTTLKCPRCGSHFQVLSSAVDAEEQCPHCHTSSRMKDGFNLRSPSPTTTRSSSVKMNNKNAVTPPKPPNQQQETFTKLFSSPESIDRTGARPPPPQSHLFSSPTIAAEISPPFVKKFSSSSLSSSASTKMMIGQNNSSNRNHYAAAQSPAQDIEIYRLHQRIAALESQIDIFRMRRTSNAGRIHAENLCLFLQRVHESALGKRYYLMWFYRKYAVKKIIEGEMGRERNAPPRYIHEMVVVERKAANATLQQPPITPVQHERMQPRVEGLNVSSQPGAVGHQKASLESESRLESIIRERIVAMYQQYAPEKLHEVDSLLSTHEDVLLLEALIKQYGPEPSTNREVVVGGESLGELIESPSFFQPTFYSLQKQIDRLTLVNFDQQEVIRVLYQYLTKTGREVEEIKMSLSPMRVEEEDLSEPRNRDVNIVAHQEQELRSGSGSEHQNLMMKNNNVELFPPPPPRMSKRKLSTSSDELPMALLSVLIQTYQLLPVPGYINSLWCSDPHWSQHQKSKSTNNNLNAAAAAAVIFLIRGALETSYHGVTNPDVAEIWSCIGGFGTIETTFSLEENVLPKVITAHPTSTLELNHEDDVGNQKRKANNSVLIPPHTSWALSTRKAQAEDWILLSLSSLVVMENKSGTGRSNIEGRRSLENAVIQKCVVVDEKEEERKLVSAPKEAVVVLSATSQSQVPLVDYNASSVHPSLVACEQKEESQRSLQHQMQKANRISIYTDFLAEISVADIVDCENVQRRNIIEAGESEEYALLYQTHQEFVIVIKGMLNPRVTEGEKLRLLKQAQMVDEMLSVAEEALLPSSKRVL